MISAREKAQMKRNVRFHVLRERIKRHIEVEPINGCWLWKGRHNKGHGLICVRVPGYRTPRPLYVHRVAWEAFHERRIPTGRVVAHSYKCVAPRCCNPEHLRATLQHHNIRDQRRAKRWRLRMVADGHMFPPLHTVIPRKRRKENATQPR